MGPTSKGKTSTDHIRSFNVAVHELKTKKHSDKVMADVEKVLMILSKITDMSAFEPGSPGVSDLLINCQFLLDTLDYKHAVVWAIVSLLSTFSTDSRLRAFLRDRLWILPSLSRLLHTIPSTTQCRTLKLLQLVKQIVQGIQITRREAFLTTLFGDLLGFLGEGTADLSSVSVFILCCLCRGSYVATRLLLAATSHSDRQDLFSASSADPGTKVAAECLCYHLSRVNLAEAIPHAAKVKEYLPKIMDAFCTAYGEDDLATMTLVTDFLSDLREDHEYVRILSEQDCLSSIQQLLVMADFSEGFNLNSSEILFSFILEVTKSYCTDHVALFDMMLKTVLARLDSKPYNHVSEALRLVKETILDMELKDVSDATGRNLKFQVDQLLPNLQTVFLDSKTGSKHSRSSKVDGENVRLSKDNIETYTGCLQLLQTISGVEGWSAQVASICKSSKMSSAYSTHLSECGPNVEWKSNLTVEFLSLAKEMSENDLSWRKVLSELIEDEHKIEMVSETLKSNCNNPATIKKALKLLSLTDIPENCFVIPKDNLEEPTVSEIDDRVVVTEQLYKLDALMESVAKAVEGMEIDSVVAEVVEVAQYRRGAEREQVESLRSALSAADARIAAQNTALVQREAELASVDRLVSSLGSKLVATKEELEDIRVQHSSASKTADESRSKLAQQLAESRAETTQRETELEKMLDKCRKYKENVETMKVDLQQYKENERLLQEKLKAEIKAKEEFCMLVQKREEKLRKKEKQLEEEMEAREKAEKEGDQLRKQCSSLETLTKRQEQALGKKDKQLMEQQEECKEMKKIQDAIFNLSRAKASNAPETA